MNKDIYKSTRICYVIEETVAYLITILISGAYLARLTSALGFSDSLTALLSSFVNLGCVFQLLAIAVFRRGRVKKKVTILFIINQLLFMLLYVVPFFKMNPTLKATLFILFNIGGNFIYNIVASPRTNWFMALIPDNHRGRFTALKEAVSLICGIAFNFTMGLMIDYFAAHGNTDASFICCGITIFVLMITHTLSLILAKEKEPEQEENNTDSTGIKDILGDKKVLSIIILSALWSIGHFVITPFLGTYQIKELGFSMTFVAVLSVVNAVARIIASVFLGKYADKTSFARMLKICYIFAAAGFVMITLTKPSNGHVMFTLYQILYAVSMGGINSAEINLVFDYVSPDKRKNALAVKQTIYGLCGFLATLAVTPLVNYIQYSGNKLFGITLYAQQVLSFISLVLTIILIFYVGKIASRYKTHN